MSELTTTQRLIRAPSVALQQKPVSRDFIDFLEVHKAVQMAWQGIEQAMLDHKVSSLKGDWGSISMVTNRKTWTTDRKLDDEYYNAPSLNVKKLNAMWENDLQLPVGLDFTVASPYIMRRLK